MPTTTHHVIEDIYPLSPLQQGMLFHTLLHEGSGVYLMQDRYTISGEINPAAILEAWRLVVTAHPSLRASFQWRTQKQPVQVIHKTVELPLEAIDLRGQNKAAQEAFIRQQLEDEQRQGFNLARPPLIRFRLVRLADDRYELIRSFHHILMDAWCISLVMVDFLNAYEALRRHETPSIRAPRPYRDYILWLQQQDGSRAERFWREQLAGLSSPTPLTVDNGAKRNRYTSAVLVDDQMIELSAKATTALTAFCRTRHLTINTFFQGAWALLLARYSNQRDVLFGVTVAGRPPELAGVEEMIGLFINTLPLRATVDDATPLSAWLTGLQTLNLEIREFEHTPLTDIQGWSAFPRGETLFDSILVYENAPIDDKILSGDFSFRLEGMEHSVHTHYGLTVVILPGARLGIRISYDRERFDAATIERMLGHLATLAESMLAAPEAPLGQFELLSAPERATLLGEWSANPQQFPLDQSYAALFAEQVTRHPHKTVAVCQGESLSYAELDERATRLAQALLVAGAERDTLVALLAPRSLELLTMMVAVFKAGAAMLPLEVAHPVERLREVLTLSRAPLLVASEQSQALLDELATGLPHAPRSLLAEPCCQDDAVATRLEPLGAPGDLAYVLFTSGSTGTPKGVMIEQRGMLNNIFGKVPALGLSEHDRLAQTASVAFDISVWQFLAAPVVGATVHILPDAVTHDAERLIATVRDERLTLLEIVPSLMRALLALCPADTAFPELRWVLPTGEALPPAVARAWFERFPAIPLMNAYGPAECADDVAFQPIFEVPAADTTHMPIGRPTANNTLFVLDEALRLLPVGVPGEICVGGVGVGRGYLYDAERSAAAFIDHPFEPDARLYRTGDIGRWRADGVIECLGRKDQQVKLRGHRIELTEIEHRLAQHPAVREAAVLLREDARGESYLVAYWAPRADAVAESLLKAHLAAQLPAYMVPAVFVELEALPLSGNDKVDRKALAAHALDWQSSEQAKVTPRTDTERVLTGIWAEVLGHKSVGVEDNFFALGGHSLLATQVVARVRARCKVELPLRALFEHATVAGLAAEVDARLAAAQEPAAAAAPALTPQPRPAQLPLSFAQQRLWFIEQLTPGSTLFNIPFALRLTGALNAAALEASLNALLARHEVLRTGVELLDDTPLQRILTEAKLTLAQDDFSALTPTERDVALAAALAETFETPFDLAQPPLLRARLMRTGTHEHVLAIALHHMASDAWSATVALRELAEAYRAFSAGQAPAWAPLPIQYADYALWQRAHLAGTELERQQGYWQRKLAEPDGGYMLALPTDYARPPVQSYRAGLIGKPLDTALSARLSALAARLGLTPFAVVFAGFAAMLHRLSGQNTLLIGTPASNRERPETEGLLGILLNNLTIRADFGPQTSFAELARQVGEALLEAQRHQDLPFEQLVESLQLPRSLSHAPLFQVMVAQQLGMEARLDFAGLAFEELETPLAHSECDLDLHVLTPAGEPIRLELMFARDLFRADSAERMLARLEYLLDQMTAAPDAPLATLPLLTAPEWQQIVLDWNRTELDFPRDATFHELFEAQVARTPERTAVVVEGAALSYAELNRRANQLAHYLRKQGVGPDRPVGLCVERSLPLFVGLIGILKAGGAYVPLDPAYPADRLAYMLEDSQPALLLAQPGLLENLPAGSVRRFCLSHDWPLVAGESEANPGNQTRPDQLAYIMYTSGSTGRPKGTLIYHRSVVNLAWARIHGLYRKLTQEPMRSSFNYSFAFDSSVAELILLLDGHTLYVTPEDSRYQPEALLAFFREHRLDTFECTPAQLKPVIEAGDIDGLPRFVLFGGDAIDTQLWQRLQRIESTQFFNTYGPTECTVDATGCHVQSAIARPVIGKPIGNVRTYILDAQLNPVPQGVPGELHIGGEGVTYGYLNRPELTAEKFIRDPFNPKPGARMYKAGDLCRFLPDGTIEYLGRIDNQVKIRGFRIELGEIEALLGKQPGVVQAVVIAREDTPGDKRLIAYLAAETPLDLSTLRQALAQELPDYMIPARLVQLPALPLTGNGKIDRKALPQPDDGDVAAASEPPQGEVEQRLAGLWAEVLNLPLTAIGRDSHFFQLGGHSLLVAKLHAQAKRAFSSVPPLRALFEQPTLAGYAALLGTGAAAPEAAITARSRPAQLPLSFAQERLWFLEQFNAGAYNIASAYALRGALDVAALRHAFETVTARHEVLRSRVLAHDAAAELVIDAPAPFALPVEEVPAADWDAACQRAATAEGNYSFDLTHEAPLRARLLQRAGSDEALLLVTLHHIAGDDWSMQVLLDELAAAYRGTALPALPLQYPDYALWQREPAQQARFAAQLDYWRTTLEDGDYRLDLPTDHPRPAQLDAKAGAVRITLPAELTATLRATAQRHGVTLYMLLLATAQLLLGRYANQRDVRVGTPVANRPLAELAPLVGCFINTLVIRSELDPALSFAEFLSQVKARLLDAQAHQDLPFEQLVEALAPERDLTSTPLFQVLFVMQNASVRDAAWPNLQLTELPVDAPAAKFDLNWEVHDSGAELSVLLEYRAALFDQATMQRWLAEWQALLARVAAAPATPLACLSPLSEADRQRLVYDWNATDQAYPGPQTLAAALNAQAAATPDATALVFEGEALSYRELHARANRLAQALSAQGIGRESVVGVCMERSLELVVALLAIAKAGGAYLPLDTAAPQSRLAFLLEDASAPLVLSQSTLAAKLPAGVPAWALDVETFANYPATEPALINAPSNLAYVLYTSGSTGQPKGVLTEQAALLNRLYWMQDGFPINGSDRVLQKTPYGFDVSVWEFFWPLMTGAALVLARPDGHRDSGYLAELIQRERVTTLHFVPAMLRAFVEEPALAHCASLRQVFASGEALPADLVARFQARHPAQLINLYGPTEAAIDVSYWVCTEKPAIVPIGKPIANLRLYVLDDALEPLPLGAIGELVIGGVGVARGYLNRPELTAASFLESPFVPGERLYKTGDRCRWLADGNIEYLGRRDHQVKLRGQRIELGEIDTALLALPGVRAAVTLLREDGGSPQLVAYLTPAELDEAALRDALANSLPPHMLPSAFVALPALPLNVNGKLDRKALPAPQRQASSRSVTAPRNDTEHILCETLQKLLGLEQVGVDDNFFALGGDSILSLQWIAQLRAHGLALAPQQVFQQRSLAELAIVATPLTGTPAAEQGELSGATPLLPIQHWFFGQAQAKPEQWRQSLLLAPQKRLEPALVEATLEVLVRQHDALRLRFSASEAGWQQTYAGADNTFAFAACRHDGGLDTLPALLAPYTKRLDLTAGPLLTTVLVDGKDAQRLYLSAHHLVVDMVSWNVLLEDFAQVYDALEQGRTPALPAKGGSYRQWAEALTRQAAQSATERQRAYWQAQLDAPALPVETPHAPNLAGDEVSLSASLSQDDTAFWLGDANQRYRTQPQELLLAALARALTGFSGGDAVRIDLEGHGRDAALGGLDVSRTVGWFTTLYPLRLTRTTSAAEAIKAAKESLRAVPDKGAGFGLLRYLAATPLADPASGRGVLFNYLGRVDSKQGGGWLNLAAEAGPAELASENTRSSELEVVAMVLDGALSIEWRFSGRRYAGATQQRLLDSMLGELRALLAHCREDEAGGMTPSDFPLAHGLSQKSLDAVLAKLGKR